MPHSASSGSYRPDQVGAQVRLGLMEIIRQDLKDPRIGLVSITQVEMSPDLRSANVGISVLGGSIEQDRSLAGLRSASGAIRYHLGKRLGNLRFIPNLRFRLDTSIEHSVEVSRKLRELLPNGEESE